MDRPPSPFPHPLHLDRIILDQPGPRWFAYLTTQMLQRSIHTSVQALEADVRGWIEQWNSDPRPLAWKKTAEEIPDSLGRYLQRISGGEH